MLVSNGIEFLKCIGLNKVMNRLKLKLNSEGSVNLRNREGNSLTQNNKCDCTSSLLDSAVQQYIKQRGSTFMILECLLAGNIGISFRSIKEICFISCRT